MGDLARQDYPKGENGLTLPLRRSLGSQDLARHRAMVAFELEVMAKKLDRFGWDRDRDTPAQDRLILDWMDTLQDYPLDEIKRGITACLDAKPNRVPNERDVLFQIIKARETFLIVNRKQTPPPDPDRQPVTAEAAARIMEEFGFRPKRFGNV